jgi:hypothetical protein
MEDYKCVCGGGGVSGIIHGWSHGNIRIDKCSVDQKTFCVLHSVIFTSVKHNIVLFVVDIFLPILLYVKKGEKVLMLS